MSRIIELACHAVGRIAAVDHVLELSEANDASGHNHYYQTRQGVPMDDKLKKALAEVFEELRAMPQEEFWKLIGLPPEPEYMPAYKLKFQMPGLHEGAVFVHDKSDSENGSYAYGCLKLAWDKGNCQHFGNNGWCGHTYILPGQLAENRDWFHPTPNHDGRWT
jgi:hypothetical protein